MSDDTQKPASATPEAGSPAGDHAEAKAAPASHAQREAPEPQFDHTKAWTEAFNKLAGLPESILDALEERSSSRKKEDKAPEEKAVQQETQTPPADAPPESPVPGKKNQSNAASRKPWGHRWLGQ